jgi:hypothetical protein
MELLESSFDLLENEQFSVPKRQDWMMPTPFVLNDAVVIRQQIKPNTLKRIIAIDSTTVINPVLIQGNLKSSSIKPIETRDSTTIKP